MTQFISRINSNLKKSSSKFALDSKMQTVSRTSLLSGKLKGSITNESPSTLLKISLFNTLSVKVFKRCTPSMDAWDLMIGSSFCVGDFCNRVVQFFSRIIVIITKIIGFKSFSK